MSTWAYVGVGLLLLGGLLWGANTLHTKIDRGGYERANGEWLARNAAQAEVERVAEEKDRETQAKKEAESERAARENRTKIRELKERIAKLEKEYEEYLTRDTADAGCQLDPAGVRLWNAANSGRISARPGEGGPRIVVPGPVSGGTPTVEVRLREASGWQPSYIGVPVPYMPDPAGGSD